MLFDFYDAKLIKNVTSYLKYLMKYVMEAMCTDFLQRATAVNLAVTGDVEMIPDILEPAVTDVVSPAIFKAQAHALRRGRAMNNKQCNGTHTLLAGTET